VTATTIPSTPAGARLRDARTAQGLSIRELAFFAGCSHTTIQRLENGTLDVAPALKAQIARQLRLPVGALWSPDEQGEGGAPGD
jgi:transcriptional regulator with XRE-family HTH domain